MTPERRNELALRAVSVLVVGSIAWALAALTWRLVGWDDGRSEVAVAESLPPLGVQAGGQDPDVARIVSLAPFGGGAATAAGGLPASTLGLVLKGVLSAYPPSASTALIAVGDGPATIYGIGQSPAANAVIESIEIDHVILNVGGARERLDFPQPVVAPVDPAAAAPGAGITVTPVAPGGTAPPPPPAGAPPPLNPGPGAVTSAAPPAQTAVATAASAGVSATASGYRIGPNPSAELRRFGLQPGDVIESLNGQAVSGATSDQQLFEQARAAGQARVVVNRDGRRLTFTFPLR